MIVKLIVATQFLAMGMPSVTGVAGAAPPLRVPSRLAVGAGQAKSMLPQRLLDCDLGRIANFDPGRNQPISDYVYDGRHAFKLFLPAIPERTGPAPSPLKPAEPVDPRTRIVFDPDGIAADAIKQQFSRVVDMWPTRIEMTTKLNGVASNVIVIDSFDVGQSSVNMFMTRANDAVTFDLKHLYYGKCKVKFN